MKYRFSIALLLIVVVNAFGQTPHSLLWKISGNGLNKPSYLFGTIHLICPKDYVWTPAMKTAFSESEKIGLEMNINDPKVMREVSEGIVDPDGKKLTDYYTPDQFKMLKKFFKDSIGMDLSMFNSMKPMAVLSMLEMKCAKCLMPQSYEEKMAQDARSTNKQIFGLEEASEQIDVLSTVPTDTAVQNLLEAPNDFSKSKEEYQKLIDAYKAQDLPRLFEMIATREGGLGDKKASFLDNRNIKWIPRMSERMKYNSVFFAVGAGHLDGENGVIQLLRKAGYKVEPQM